MQTIKKRLKKILKYDAVFFYFPRMHERKARVFGVSYLKLFTDLNDERKNLE